MPKPIRFEGDLELERILQEISELDARDIQDVVLEALQPIVDDARRLAPKASGRLAESINAQVTEVSPDRIEAEVGSPEFYAGFVELGTDKIAAHPFIRPAVDAGQREAGKRLARAVRMRTKGGT